jgi:hypothetical protein
MSLIPKLLTAAAFTAAASLFAGGFWLQLGSPEASPDAQSKNAVLIVQATGCHDPANAKVTGHVILTIDHRQQTTPLKLLPMKQPGAFAVIRDWPSDAAVTLEFIGHNAEQVTSLLVKAHGDTVQKASAKFYPRLPTRADEEELASLVR